MERDVLEEEVDMQDEDMRMLRECLAQRSAESQKQRGMLRRLTKKQEQLNDSITQLSAETSVAAECFESCRREFRQLEGLVGQCKEQVQAMQEAARKNTEAWQREKLYAEAGASLRRETEALSRAISDLREEIDDLEAWQLQRESETLQTARPELLEEQLERDSLARRCGFIYWLQTLCVLFASPKLALIFLLAAAVLFASWTGLDLFYYILLYTLSEETYSNVACALGRILPVVSEGPLPF